MNDTLYILLFTCTSIGIYSCHIDIMSFIINLPHIVHFLPCMHTCEYRNASNFDNEKIDCFKTYFSVCNFVGGYICVVLCGFYGCWTAETTPCVHATTIDWGHSRLRKPSSPILYHQVRCLSKIVFGFNNRLMLMEGNWMG